ncbi:MAG TPA: septal ring lytic transglycosylase RlpA family protein [Gammaproteobacteria bacterium]|nr:septal ring lytic transglycosylase RlpA family protein [Gammaproteobacteria bacterium]
MGTERRAQCAAILATLLLAGCSFGPRPDFDPASVPDAVPQPVERSQYGNPDSYVVFGKRYNVLDSSVGYDERGIASWYGPNFDGKRTSSGEIYDMYKMTAANKVLPLPTYARVTNLENHRSVVVKINDRGPFHKNRIIDLSYAAAAKLGMLKKGTALVDVRAISVGEPPSPDAVAASEPAPASLPAKPQIYVQVGAFADHDNAMRMKARLTLAAVGPVLVQPATSNGERLYRVRIGPLPTVNAVDALTKRLGQLGIGQTQVIIP